MMRWLDKNYIWKGRNYPYGEQEIPEDLNEALGAEPSESGSGSEGSGSEGGGSEAPAEPEEGADALALVNGATSSSPLTVLPGIGPSGATILFDNRPVGGYISFASMQSLNVALTITPFSVDWTLVAAWTP